MHVRFGQPRTWTQVLVLNVTSVYGAAFHDACIAYFGHNRDHFDDRCACKVWSTETVMSGMVLTATRVSGAAFQWNPITLLDYF